MTTSVNTSAVNAYNNGSKLLEAQLKELTSFVSELEVKEPTVEVKKSGFLSKIFGK